MITPVQRKAMVFIEAYQARTGKSPSFRDVGEGLSLSGLGNVHRLLHVLENRGFIKLRYQGVRNIKVVRPVSKFAVFLFDDEHKQLKRVA